MNRLDTPTREADTITVDSSARTTEQVDGTDDTTYSTWFGPESASLFGTVHVPRGGRARGGVVLCPPLGKEQVDSYRGLALLAQKLCAQGLLVLRFDYEGTGDSSGPQDAPDAVTRWTRSIETAVEFVRECGVTDVGLVGLRAGALLAAPLSANTADLRALVLWDPVVSGRSYLREQRALYSVSVATDSESDPRVSIVGAVFHADVAQDFAALDTTKLTPAECPVLVATRSERGTTKAIRKVVDTQNAEERTLSGHDLFLEPVEFVVVLPTADIVYIADWTQKQFDDGTSAVTVPVRTVAEFQSESGTATETMDRIGTEGLFAIRTTSPSCRPGGPTAVFYQTAIEHRVGPVRMWVELAREFAARGVSVVRFDRRGTGESGAVADDEMTRLYSPEGNEDAVAAVRSTGVSPENLMVSSLCSGSWYSMHAAQQFGAKSAVLLNSFDWTTRHLTFVKSASLPDPSAGLSGSTVGRLHDFGVTVKNKMQTTMPYSIWHLLGRVGLIQVPEVMLAEMKARGVQTTVLLSPNDSAWFVANRGIEGLARLRRKKNPAGATFEVKSYVSGDHTLYARDLRETVKAQLFASAESAFGLNMGQSAPPSPVEWNPL